MPSSPPIVSQSSVDGIECYALIDTCGGSVPCLDEITHMFRGPFSDDGLSVPIQCVAGRQAVSTSGNLRLHSPLFHVSIVFLSLAPAIPAVFKLTYLSIRSIVHAIPLIVT